MNPNEIDPTDADALYHQARLRWGTEAQLAKAAEEFAELAATVSRIQNGQATDEELLEEMADARLMLEQLETEYADDDVEEAYETAWIRERDNPTTEDHRVYVLTSKETLNEHRVPESELKRGEWRLAEEVGVDV